MTTATDQTALKSSYTVTSTAEVSVDLVEYFTGLNPQARAEYWRRDLQGYEEWERPWCYVHEHLYEGSEGVNTPRPKGFAEGYADLEVEQDDRINEKTYEALLAAVPWMQPEQKPSDEAMARTPGPNDRPMF